MCLLCDDEKAYQAYMNYLDAMERQGNAADPDKAMDAVLDALEAEAIHIFREAAAQFRKPVLLYSIGKDSTVLLHGARKAFWPQKLPFPLLHIDTGHNFDEVIEFRDRRTVELGGRAVAELDHLLELPPGVDVQHGERHLAGRERLDG